MAKTEKKKGQKINARGRKDARSSAPPAAPAGSSAAVVGFEATLWLAADKLRNNTGAAEYKHVLLPRLLSGDLSLDITCTRLGAHL